MISMKNHQLIEKKNGWVKVFCFNLLIGVPAIALTSTAMSVSQLNSSPRLFSQVPSDRDDTPRESSPPTITPVTPPLPEQVQPPSAMVVPVNGKVNVTLVNQTYTDVAYEVIGDTQPRTLSGRSYIRLQGLKTPVNITFQRPDRGLLRVSPQSSEAGMLEVTLRETTDLGTDKSAMTIQETGAVLLN
jgi:hypothetical protein